MTRRRRRLNSRRSPPELRRASVHLQMQRELVVVRWFQVMPRWQAEHTGNRSVVSSLNTRT
jgi:hypothetical protein